MVTIWKVVWFNLKSRSNCGSPGMGTLTSLLTTSATGRSTAQPSPWFLIGSDITLTWTSKQPGSIGKYSMVARCWIVHMLSNSFSRYRDTSEWKPFHHDAAAMKVNNILKVMWSEDCWESYCIAAWQSKNTELHCSGVLWLWKVQLYPPSATPN